MNVRVIGPVTFVEVEVADGENLTRRLVALGPETAHYGVPGLGLAGIALAEVTATHERIMGKAND